MALNIKLIRERLLAKDKELESYKNRKYPSIFPYWMTKPGDETVFRFLPDGNKENPFFWREQHVFEFPFSGIVGQDTKGTTKVTVPCMTQWGEQDSISTEVNSWRNDADLAKIARNYWRKVNYVFQGFVVKTNIMEDRVPTTPVRRLRVIPSVFGIIDGSIKSGQLDTDPTDYELGRDMVFIRNQNDFSESFWSADYRPLSEAERAAVEELGGLPNLDDTILKKPGPDERDEIRKLFEASVSGEPYDPNMFQYYKPYGLKTFSDTNGITNGYRTKAANPPTGSNEGLALLREMAAKSMPMASVTNPAPHASPPAVPSSQASFEQSNNETKSTTDTNLSLEKIMNMVKRKQ